MLNNNYINNYHFLSKHNLIFINKHNLNFYLNIEAARLACHLNRYSRHWRDIPKQQLVGLISFQF